MRGRGGDLEGNDDSRVHRRMAIAATMSTAEHERDGHEHDVVMPGFRFHPTEEELIEFYLRRKVEGKRFNIELISFLDLYRYDPWELPALATIGEKEWYFYVPRDRKYRNGDRPNRVTTSGYWKATGADRMIRTEHSRPIGLKKTLVFYSGKAPKGIRSSWTMNEYRLPRSETDQYQKAEIALCRVYKRSGVNDHYQLPGTLSSRPSSSRGTGSEKKHNMGHPQSSSFCAFQGDSSSSKIEKAYQLGDCSSTAVIPPSSTTSTEEEGTPMHPSINAHPLVPACTLLSSTSPSVINATMDELGRAAEHHQSYLYQANHFFPLPSQSQLLHLHALPSLQVISDKLWEWAALPDTATGYAGFK